MWHHNQSSTISMSFCSQYMYMWREKRNFALICSVWFHDDFTLTKQLDLTLWFDSICSVLHDYYKYYPYSPIEDMTLTFYTGRVTSKGIGLTNDSHLIHHSFHWWITGVYGFSIEIAYLYLYKICSSCQSFVHDCIKP